MPHANMTLVIIMLISCIIVASQLHVLNGQQVTNIVNSNTYSIYCLCDEIIMTSSFTTNALCNLSNVTTSCFSCKCHLQLKTSYKLQSEISNFFQMKPNVSHFKMFGCIAYVHVIHENRSKLDLELRSVSSLDIPWNIGI